MHQQGLAVKGMRIGDVDVKVNRWMGIERDSFRLPIVARWAFQVWRFLNANDLSIVWDSANDRSFKVTGPHGLVTFIFEPENEKSETTFFLAVDKNLQALAYGFRKVG